MVTCHKCEEEHTTPVALRKCKECENIGCCDSTPGKHAREHWKETGHSVMQPLDGGWTWCYDCNDYVEANHKHEKKED